MRRGIYGFGKIFLNDINIEKYYGRIKRIRGIRESNRAS